MQRRLSSLLFLLLMLSSVFVFLGLGTWQLYRKGEKEALIAALVEGRALPLHNVDDKGSLALFQPVVAEGRFLPDKTIFLLVKTHKGKAGQFVLDVLRTQGGKFLLVQRGWTQRKQVRVSEGLVRIEGTARIPSAPSLFQPVNTPPIYFWIDLPLLAREIGHPLLPYYMVAKASDDPAILPTDPVPFPPNNHFQYAMTWYGLACVVLFMLLYRNTYFLKKD